MKVALNLFVIYNIHTSSSYYLFQLNFYLYYYYPFYYFIASVNVFY